MSILGEHGSRSRLLMVTGLVAVLATPLGLALVGCGGGGGGAESLGSVGISIAWPPRPTDGVQSQVIPLASESIQVEILRAGSQIAERTVTVNRPATRGTITGLRSGDAIMRATAYPEANARGVPQATAERSIVIVGGQRNEFPLTLVSTITSVVVTPPRASVNLGGTVRFTATALDAQGRTVLVPATGAFTWSIVSGQAYVSQESTPGTFLGRRIGTAIIAAEEKDSKVSGTAQITVTQANPRGSIYGTIRAMGGSPIAGASATTSDGTTLYSATSDTNGDYNINTVPNGSRVVSFSATGYETVSKLVVVAGEPVQVDGDLPPLTGPAPTGRPNISLGTPVVDSTLGIATISGTITGMDSSTAVLVHNGFETLVALDSSGNFTQDVILQNGANDIRLRATNANGTTISENLRINYSGTGQSAFYFRVTLWWDTPRSDMDLHIWEPGYGPPGDPQAHSWFGNRQIASGELDHDDTSGLGPENFTCRNMTRPGRFRVGVNNYDLHGDGPTACTIRVYSGSLASGIPVDTVRGPYILTVENANGDYPVTENTASWWRPCDVILGIDGSVEVVDPAEVPLGRSLDTAQLRFGKPY